MVFSDYMNLLKNERQETIAEIAKLTCSTPASVYRWVNGSVVPPILKQRIIADYLKRPIEDLWPAEAKEAEHET